MNPWRSLRGLPRPLFALAAATLVNCAGRMVLPFLVLFLTRSVGLAAEVAATILAVYGVTALVASPLGGRLCDRYSPRTIAIVSLAMSGVVMLIYPLATTTPELVVATIALAFTGEMFRPASMTLFGNLATRDQRKQAFALHRLAINLGMTVGPAMGGFLAGWWFPAIFLVDATTAIASAVLMLVTVKVPSELAGEEADDRAAEDSAAIETSSRRVYRDPAFLYFLLAMLVSGLVFFQLDAALPLYLVRDLAMSEQTFGILFTVNTVLIILFEVALNDATSHWPMRRSMALGAFLVALGFGAYGLASGAITAALCVVVWTFGEMILFPASSAYVSDVAPPGRTGEYMGWFTMAFGLAFTVAPWAGTVVLERFGSTFLWSSVLVLGLIAAGFFALVREPLVEPDA